MVTPLHGWRATAFGGAGREAAGGNKNLNNSCCRRGGSPSLPRLACLLETGETGCLQGGAGSGCIVLLLREEDFQKTQQS